MNKKIQELVEKATKYYSNGYVDCPELDSQLFAELLIKECAHLCVVVAEETEAAQPNKGYEESAYTCHERIKEHFGVK